MHVHSCITSRTRTIGLSTVLATVLASLAVVALAGSAHAGSTSDTEEPYSRPCFMVRSHWNVALDGPQPLCPVPTRAG